VVDPPDLSAKKTALLQQFKTLIASWTVANTTTELVRTRRWLEPLLPWVVGGGRGFPWSPADRGVALRSLQT